MSRVQWSVTPAEAIEGVVGVLLCRENPEATRIKPSQGDGGIDVLVAEPHEPRRIEVYQVKSFTSTLTAGQKGQIKRSLRRAREFCTARGWTITCWYLTLPLIPTHETRAWFEELTVGEEFPCRWRGLDFLEGLAARYPEVIDYYLLQGRERLAAHMTAHVEALRLAQRAARRATRPGEAVEPAPLEPAEALAGLGGLYDLLNRDDPHYRYEFAVSAAPPPIDQAEHLLVAVVQEDHPTRCVTIKVFAHFVEAVIERPVPGLVTIDPTGDEQLGRDLELFERYGRPFRAPPGTVTSEIDLPGGLGGRLEGGSATIGPAGDAPAGEQLRVVVVDPMGEVLAGPVLDLQPRFQGRDGQGRSSVEQHGAFGFEVLTDGSGTGSLSVRGLDLTGRRPALLLEGLRFVVEFHHPNRFGFRPVYGSGSGSLSAIPEDGEQHPQTEAVYEFVEALAIIQEHTTVQVFVPDVSQMSGEQQRTVVQAARLLRGEVVRSTWTQIRTMHLNPGITIDAADRFAVRLYKPLIVELPDLHIDLGMRQIDLPIARIDGESLRAHDDHQDVRLVPAGSDVCLFRHNTPEPGAV